MLSKLQQLKEEREQGFTLIELLVVILIIGILAAIAIPAFLNQRKSAVDSSVQADLNTVAKAVSTLEIKNAGQVTNVHVRVKDAATNLWTVSLGASALTSPNAMAADVTLSKGNTFSYSGTTNGYSVKGMNDGGDISNKGGFVYESANGGLKALP